MTLNQAILYSKCAQGCSGELTVSLVLNYQDKYFCARGKGDHCPQSQAGLSRSSTLRCRELTGLTALHVYT